MYITFSTVGTKVRLTATRAVCVSRPGAPSCLAAGGSGLSDACIEICLVGKLSLVQPASRSSAALSARRLAPDSSLS